MQELRPGPTVSVALTLALAGCAAQEQVADAGNQYAFRLARTFSSVNVLVTRLVGEDRAAYAPSLVAGC